MKLFALSKLLCSSTCFLKLFVFWHIVVWYYLFRMVCVVSKSPCLAFIKCMFIQHCVHPTCCATVVIHTVPLLSSTRVCHCCHPHCVHPICGATVCVQLVFIQLSVQLCSPACVHPTCPYLRATVVIQLAFIQLVFIVSHSRLCLFTSSPFRFF